MHTPHFWSFVLWLAATILIPLALAAMILRQDARDNEKRRQESQRFQQKQQELAEQHQRIDRAIRKLKELQKQLQQKASERRVSTAAQIQALLVVDEALCAAGDSLAANDWNGAETHLKEAIERLETELNKQPDT